MGVTNRVAQSSRTHPCINYFFLIILKCDKLSNYLLITKKNNEKKLQTINLGLLAIRNDLVILLFLKKEKKNHAVFRCQAILLLFKNYLVFSPCQKKKK